MGEWVRWFLTEYKPLVYFLVFLAAASFVGVPLLRELVELARGLMTGPIPGG